jgi:hypothetical protein
MSFRTTVSIVASPRPRVGKTLLARLVTAFHRHEGRPVAAFDLNAGEGTLARFLPGDASTAAIGEIQGQMALFDALVANDGVHKVVDLGVNTFEAFFALAEKIGFGEEARARGIVPSILFMLTPDRTSIQAFRGLRRHFPAVTLSVVHNEVFGPTQHRDRYALGFDEVVTRMPLLAPALRKYIETPPFSFDEAQLARATDIPLEAHIELQRWLRRSYAELRELEQRMATAA